MSAGFTARLVSMAEAERRREEILKSAPEAVRARAAACARKGKAFQILAADWYMRQTAAEEGLGEAERIRVGHEGSGKPFLLSGGIRVERCVSISHCDGYLYLCLAEGPIGCDVEMIRRIPVNGGLKGFFSEADLAAIREAEQPEEQLIHIWTRREAYAKLTGITEGLRTRSFHDREEARRVYGVRFTEGRADGALYTVAQYENAEHENAD